MFKSLASGTSKHPALISYNSVQRTLPLGRVSVASLNEMTSHISGFLSSIGTQMNGWRFRFELKLQV